MPATEDDLVLLLEAARQAGAIASRHFRTELQVTDKGAGQGPVTNADLAVDRALHDILLTARPGHGWLSEETADTPDRLDRPRVFIVDPIDGTRAFVKGEAHFAISVALAEEGRVVAGVVHLPEMGLTYAARLGAGATLNGTPLCGSGCCGVEGARILAARRQMEPALWPGGVPPVSRHFRSSLAWRMCLAAEGRFDAMLTLRDAWEWDIAAGSLICTEAGLAVTDRRGLGLRFNNPVPQTAGVLAAPPDLHRQLMRHLGH